MAIVMGVIQQVPTVLDVHSILSCNFYPIGNSLRSDIEDLQDNRGSWLRAQFIFLLSARTTVDIYVSPC